MCENQNSNVITETHDTLKESGWLSLKGNQIVCIISNKNMFCANTVDYAEEANNNIKLHLARRSRAIGQNAKIKFLNERYRISGKIIETLNKKELSKFT